MIVVVGSRHDPVAAELVRRWPGAELCDADDLMAPGWVWPARHDPAQDERRWVVGGEIMPDADVTGVFLRRSAVFPDELAGSHPDDRAYLASEALAFLVYVLATTRAFVVNPVGEGALGADALRPERWMQSAAGLGLPVAPLRLRSATDSGESSSAAAARPETLIEVVAGTALTTGGLGDAAAAVAGALGLVWAVVGFDRDGRLCALTTTLAPSPRAADQLGVLLAGASGLGE